MSYRPRRASKRWLDGDCPRGVLAIFDNGGETFDRYTVMYADTTTDDKNVVWIGYRGMSADPFHPQGIGIYAQMPWWEARAYRRRVWHQSCKWSDLPDKVKKSVRQDCVPD